MRADHGSKPSKAPATRVEPSLLQEACQGRHRLCPLPSPHLSHAHSPAPHFPEYLVQSTCSFPVDGRVLQVHGKDLSLATQTCWWVHTEAFLEMVFI